MTHNPYAPPSAEVADVVFHHTRKKPIQIVVAFCCLWGIVALILGSAVPQFVIAIDWQAKGSTAYIAGGIFGVFLVLLAAKWLIGKIAIGRNWSRFVILAFALYWLVVSPIRWKYLVDLPSLEAIVRAAAQLLSLTATGLVFIGPGRHWYKRH